jgi:PTS system nitrogen regulatory IIA component
MRAALPAPPRRVTPAAAEGGARPDLDRNMGVTEILTPEHVSVAGAAEGVVTSKREAIHRLSALLAQRLTVASAGDIEHVLNERERLQSTGVGGGVAIPHGSIDRLDRTIGAVLLCPAPIPFDAIDGAPVSILFAVIAPRRATGEHLKTLARVSRLLRDDHFRERLVAAPSGHAAYALIAAEEGRAPAP